MVTHGRSDKPGTFIELGKSLREADRDSQVLLLDWSSASAPSSGRDLSEGRWFTAIGQKLGDLLIKPQPGGAARFTGEELNFAGHSWGTYVNYEVAKNVPYEVANTRLGVNRMVALDPALAALNYDVLPVDFSSVSAYSMGFWSSVYGNASRAATATDSFNIDVDDGNSGVVLTKGAIKHHAAAHEYFRDLLPSQDLVGLSIRGALLNKQAVLWDMNPSIFLNYVDAQGNVHAKISANPVAGFEALITIKKSGAKWKPTRFYFSAP